MADHCRTQIRDAIRAYLVANMGTVSSIQTGRVHPIDTDSLPALLIFTNEETVEDMNKGQDGSRKLVLTIEGHAIGDGLVDTLDGIAKEVEPLIFAGVPAWVKEVEINSTTVELSGEAVQPAGLIRLEFMITYHINPAAPDTPL